MQARFIIIILFRFETRRFLYTRRRLLLEKLERKRSLVKYVLSVEIENPPFKIYKVCLTILQMSCERELLRVKKPESESEKGKIFSLHFVHTEKQIYSDFVQTIVLLIHLCILYHSIRDDCS